MSHTPFAELLQNLAQQVESMNSTVVAAVGAYRQESDDLLKKNQALQAALLAKASEASAAAAAASQVTAKPRSFADHLSGGVVKLTVFNRELYVHRSILSSIPFFEAKREHWSDEPVKLPEEVTEVALDHLLMRLYVGGPLPAGNVALCTQVIHLAKYWLLDVIVAEMVAEVLEMAKEDDVPVLDDLAKRFDIEELSVAVEKLKGPPCSLEDLRRIVGQALIEGDVQAQRLCTPLLKEHPDARHVLREQFTHYQFPVESRVFVAGDSTWRTVDWSGRFEWFWEELKGAGLLKTDLPFISRIFMSKLTPGALASRENFRPFFGPVGDMIDSAADLLRTGSLQPVDVKDLLTWLPACLLRPDDVDVKMAKLITDLLPATARKVFQIMMGRIADVGPKAAAALQKVAAVGQT